MTEIALSPARRPLGNSGIMVPPMAWGTWRFAGDDVGRARERVEAAIEAGLTLFDEADIYGPDNNEPFGASETLLGRVFAEAPRLRDRIVLASKGGIRLGVPYDSSPAYLADAIDASLRRMHVEHIDLWQVHRPDMLTHPAEVAKALEAARAAGKIGAIGVSNHSPAQTAALAAHLPGGLASVQDEFSALAPEPLFDGRLDAAMTHDYAVLAWSPLAQGRLGGGDSRAGRMVADDERTPLVRDALAGHGERFGVDATAAAYAWIMAHPARPIPIVGSQQPARIRAAAGALRVTFTRAEWYAILVKSRGRELP